MTINYSNNRNLAQPVPGTESGAWGTVLNNAVMGYLDNILGATQAITINSSDVNLTVDQWNNAAFNLTGTLTGNRSLVLPLNANSATVAVGGYCVVNNQTTGAFQVTVKTAASGSTGVTVPQGTTAILYSDTLNVVHADNSKLQIIPYSGNPNGNVAGTAASANNPPSVVWDFTGAIWYVCTTTGTTTTAVWTNLVASAAPAPAFEGYLTPVSNTPIITSDAIAATAIYYAPLDGSWTAIHNGSNIIPYRFSQMQLTLTSSQAANNIYDIFLAYNGGTPVIGTGPSWLGGTGGSITAGSCARGTGTGGTAIQRDSTTGLWVNAASMSLIWNTGSGNTTITVAAGQGIFLGSIFVDATAGQVTCHRSAGQNRKWGISNAYNRHSVRLIATDTTSSWTYNSATVRASNNAPSSFTGSSFNVGSGTSCNGINVFNCLAEEEATADINQQTNPTTVSSNASQTYVGVGWNSTTAFSGKVGSNGVSVGGAFTQWIGNNVGQYVAAPFLGVGVAVACESVPQGSGGGSGATFYGTNTNMQMVVGYEA